MLKEGTKRIKGKNNEKTAKIGSNHTLHFTHHTSNKGITLIALIITIIVMLILVAVTISMAINGGLFEKAGQAVGETQNAIDKEQQLANGKIQVEGLWYDSIDDYLAGNYSSVTNPYDEDGWVMAWTCTNGVWSDTIQAGGTAEGDIVAKLYETGKRITPDGFKFLGKTFTFNEGNEYKLVLEGQGEMGRLIGAQSREYNGWQKHTGEFVTGESDTCIIPYVSEIIVCDGITNIGSYAFIGATSLSKLIMANTITKIGASSFMFNTNLSNTKLPSNLTNIESSNAFDSCTRLTNITIPKGVTSIGNRAFQNCTSLTSITYEGTQAEWNDIAKNSEWALNSSIAKIICTDGEISL